MTEQKKIELSVGQTYIQADPNAWPEAMRGAEITITNLYPQSADHELSVGYSFVDTAGLTGEGTMQRSRAEQFLQPA